MKHMKRILLVILTLALVIGLVACGPKDKPDTQGGDKKFKVGINNWGVANFFARKGKAALEDELAKLGCEVVSTVTDDVTSRMEAIENLAAQGCDAIIVEEGDINEVATACKEARESGIIIGSMDAGTADFVDVYVSSDNHALGKSVGEILAKEIDGKGRIVEIISDAGSMIRMRRDAVHEVLEDYPDIEIAYSISYAWPDFYTDTKNKIEAILQANPNPGDISAIFASFDGVGVAAADAVREAGLQDSIVIVGIDGDPDAYEEMRKDDTGFVATMAQDPDTIARVCVQEVVKLLEGKEIENNVIYIPGFLVTKDNIPDE
ncbi:MAG: sugar ABC transporter substrate-binding protein [Saccharofermentanales bacterium]|jgi:ribose transport system substrate-binding protein